MPLYTYSSTPFQNPVGPVDTFVSPGTTPATFYLTNKPASQLASTVQFGAIEYYFYNQGFTVNTANNSFTLASTPAPASQGVAPAISQLGIAAFDQPVVQGVTNPTVAQVPFWLIDNTTINNMKYEPLPSYPGIQLSVVQLISGSLAQTSWIQMACSDASGNALTYGASGAPLYTAAIDMFTQLASTYSPGSNVLLVSSASSFIAGDYIIINIGNATSETVHIIATNPTANLLYTDQTGIVYTHYPGENIYTCGRQFWMQLTIPNNAANNTAVNLYNIGLQRIGAIQARP